MTQHKTETRDNMHVEWDAPIPADDGVILRGDIFRPLGDGKYPVILSYGPYAKGLEFKQGYKANWTRLIEAAPNVLEGSSNKYQNWELVDPEKWVPGGYAIVRVDSRGAGRSPGLLDCWSPREAKDLYDCIEWAGTQAWSNGKVGVNGISYYAMNQWNAGALRPPHLAALCIWEGSSDYYRELCRHGGILCDFLGSWYDRQVLSVQHGVGDRGARSAVTGETIAGPETLSPEELRRNRADLGREALERRFIDDYYRARTAEFEKIEAPLLSAANWGGMGLHPRGNFEGYLRAGSRQKWLEVHGHTHFTHFYSSYGEALQKRFFGYFLKGEHTGWDKQPKVALNIRWPGEKFELRAENEWPLARTQWTKYYLDAEGLVLAPDPGEIDTTSKAFAESPATAAEGLNSTSERGRSDLPLALSVGGHAPESKGEGASKEEQTITYDATGDGVTFFSAPMREDLEITGPVAVKLWVSSDTTDADIFVALRLYDPQGKEVTFIGSNDPRTPIGLGWLRASHRKLDEKESKPYRPVHTHDEEQPLKPGEPVGLDIEIWPTCIVAPANYRLALTVRGKDYEYDGTDAGIANAAYPMKGVGPFTHTHPEDRPQDVFGGTNTLHFAPGKEPYVLLPIIPAS
jgi:putative CocE/NonD family hydrolase